MLHLKTKYHVCWCDCYYEGTLKQFNAPSARMLKTNRHVESFQPQFLRKEVQTDQLAEALHCGIQLCNSTRQRDVGLHFGPMHQDSAPVGDEFATGRSPSIYISSPVTVSPKPPDHTRLQRLPGVQEQP